MKHKGDQACFFPPNLTMREFVSVLPQLLEVWNRIILCFFEADETSSSANLIAALLGEDTHTTAEVLSDFDCGADGYRLRVHFRGRTIGHVSYHFHDTESGFFCEINWIASVTERSVSRETSHLN